MPTDIQIVKPDLIIEGNNIATPKRAALNFINATVTDDAINNQTNVTIPPSGITIGTTPITSGVAGRVLFEGSGNVVQEDANFTYDETLKRLTLKAVGALSTDIAFRIRNSADTLDIIRANGAGDVFVGLGAGRVSTGSGNTAIGFQSLFSNTSSGSNTAIGNNSLLNSTGASNTALGFQSLYTNSSGGGNVAIGANSLLSNTTGNNNVSNGFGSLNFNTTGSNNVADGFYAGRFIADGTTANTITNNSIYLGNNTKALANNQTNQIVIGDSATGLGSNTAVLGNDSITLTGLKGNVAIGATSASAKLDIKSQGALSTDVAFRVRNSADTSNLMSVQGDGNVNFLTRTNLGFQGMTTTGGALFVYAGNSADFMSRWINTVGNPCIDFRTNADGGQIILRNHLGVTSLTLDGRFSNAVDFADSRDIGFGTGGGTRIGYATNQKLAFWNATPIVQPTTAVTAATLTSNLGTILTDTDTFDGYTMKQVVKALRNMGILA
jgi:hypothetical protein